MENSALPLERHLRLHTVNVTYGLHTLLTPLAPAPLPNPYKVAPGRQLLEVTQLGLGLTLHPVLTRKTCSDHWLPALVRRGLTQAEARS